MTIRLTQKQSWFLLLTLSLLVSLLIHSTREAHLLCLRLLLPLHGKTFVQGQPEGCILYTIPNVQFSEGYRNELRQQSDRSADDFLLAVATRDWSSLKAPAPSAWTNHALLEWAALICSYTQSSDHTNAHDRQEAFELIRTAQAANNTNGALWLAEALVSFDSNQDEAAIAALRTAAEKSNWITDDENDVQYLSSLYQKAGLSALDAALEANIARVDIFTLSIQGKIKKHLQRLMAEAVSSENDHEFTNLLNLLVELRKADWPGRNVNLQNAFRFFGAEDELFEAMRMRMKLEPESSSDYSRQREFQQKVFRDYLASQTDQVVVSRFWGQADVVQTEKKLRQEIRSGPSYRSEMFCMVCTTLSGACSALLLYLLIISVLQELPFTWLRNQGEIRGTWPKAPRFWICSIILLAVGMVLGRNFFLSLGIFSEVGLRTSDSVEVASPFMKAPLISGVLSMVWFLALLLAWKTAKKPTNSWPAVLAFGSAYLLCIVAMAYFRSQLADWVSSSL